MKQGDEILDGFPQDVTETLVAYLSGELSRDQRDAFDARLLEDEFFSQQVEEAQFALLEEYAQGTLPREIHERLAKWVSSTEYSRRHIGITRSLERLSSSSQSRRFRSGIIWLLLAACVVLAALLPMFVRRYTAPSPLVAKLEHQHGPVAATPAAETTILLTAERLRGSDPSLQPLRTYPIREELSLRLQIVLPVSHRGSAYSVTVRSETNSQPLAHFSAVKVQGSARAPYVEVILPPHALPAGEYRADVRTPGDQFDMRFRVDQVR